MRFTEQMPRYQDDEDDFYPPQRPEPARRRGNPGLRLLGGALVFGAVVGTASLVASDDTPQTTQTVWIEDVDGQTNTEIVHYDLNGQEGSAQYFCARDGEGHYGASGMVRHTEGPFDPQRFADTLGNNACYNGVASADSDEAFLAITVALADEALVPKALR